MEMLLLSALLSSTVIALVIVSTMRRCKNRSHLPPGPKPIPIIGNIFDMPRTRVGRAFSALTKKHGDIVYLNVLGRPMVVLGSFQAVLNLLEKKSANFSGRPVSIVMTLLSLDSLFVLMQYGSNWRLHRRAFHLSFGIQVDRVMQYQSIQLTSARRLLSRLLASPHDLEENISSLVSDTAMRAVYGIDLVAEDGNGEFYQMVEMLRRIVDPLLLPEGTTSLLEIFPFLRYLPSWLPGIHIKKTIVEGRRALHSACDKLHAMSMAANAEGVARDSMATRLLANASEEVSQTPGMKELQYVAATTFLASVETTHAVMEVFFLAAAMHPNKQKVAQEELDAIIGPGRLPEFSDLDHLPYMRAFIKEVMRWHIVTPVGVPHATIEDDEYNGYFIPAGTIVNANVWALSRDPEEYPDPDAFKPERFLGDKPPRDPADYVFGFGRRICPGRHFAAASLFIYCASVLHVFDILPPKDENGNPVAMEYRPKDDLVSHVDGYDYIIQPRSAKAKALVTNLML